MTVAVASSEARVPSSKPERANELANSPAALPLLEAVRASTSTSLSTPLGADGETALGDTLSAADG